MRDIGPRLDHRVLLLLRDRLVVEGGLGERRRQVVVDDGRPGDRHLEVVDGVRPVRLPPHETAREIVEGARRVGAPHGGADRDGRGVVRQAERRPLGVGRDPAEWIHGEHGGCHRLAHAALVALPQRERDRADRVDNLLHGHRDPRVCAHRRGR